MTIVSHKHRFIFVKNPKTASSSLEVAFSRQCGPKDILTQHPDEDCQDVRPQNNEGWLGHEPAASIKERLGDTTWRNYFKVTFVRNPWDKLVSWYWWQREDTPGFGLNGAVPVPFLEWAKDDERLRESAADHLLLVDGELPFDFIGRYEALEADYCHVCSVIGMEPALPLPRLKTQQRKDRRHYSAYYDAATRQRVADISERYIREFGYTFEEIHQ